MANVTVKAQLMLASGELVSMSGTLAEGSESELQTSTTYSTSATSLGQFANGKVITQIVQPPTAPNGIAYAYIERRGAIVCVLPVAIDGVQNEGCAMPFSFPLQAGDTLQVKPNTSASREFAYSVITSNNVHAIFTGTPSGAGNSHMVAWTYDTLPPIFSDAGFRIVAREHHDAAGSFHAEPGAYDEEPRWGRISRSFRHDRRNSKSISREGTTQALRIRAHGSSFKVRADALNGFTSLWFDAVKPAAKC